MAIFLQTVDIKHERRLRALFTNTLAGGAFGAPAPAYYTVTNIDGKGPDPGVQAAFIVSGSPTVVELALQYPLVRGALYRLSAVGVPAVDASVTAGGTSFDFRWGFSAPKADVEPMVRDREALLYFTDLLWTGADFLETPTGDLERVSGTANVTKALNRGVEANGLPWDPTWGGFAREYVDSPSIMSGTLKGSISSQILRDPRVLSAKVTHEIEDDKTSIYADPILVSGETADRVTIVVPTE